MEQRVSLITLGVQDVEASSAFYAALGWERAGSGDGPVVYQLLGQALGLYPLEDLAGEIGVSPDRLRTGAMVLSYNVRARDEVAEVLALAEAAGGTVINSARDVFWGGHHGHFADPDGHIWEVAWNPYSPLGPDGAFRWGSGA